jgi:3-oxoacyl-[acyl-carrier protein] reductase
MTSHRIAAIAHKGEIMKTGRLSGKVAIVTGASKGIGAGIALAMGREGAAVAVNYSSSEPAARKVTEEILAAGGKAAAIQGDVSKADDIARLFAETKKAFGTPNVLVNNAGVFRPGPFVETTEDTFHWHYNINVLGPVLTTLEAIKHFGDKGGSIINISSIVGSHPRPMIAIYSSTKSAVENLTRGLALELGGRNIRVNAIAPGHTVTEGTAAMFAGEVAPTVAKESVFKRLGQAEDIAPLAVFLASDEARWITGEIIRASGGTI